MANTLDQTEISYDVPGFIPPVAQPKSMACWATVATMAMSWKDELSYTIEGAMDSLRGDFRQIYESNSGLAPDRIQDFSLSTGMTVEYQRCETPESILQLLESYGPLIIIADEDSSASFAVHARIITGIYGGGQASDTYLKIVDPNGGTTYDELFEDFVFKYEAMADATGWNLQMMHY